MLHATTAASPIQIRHTTINFSQLGAFLSMLLNLIQSSATAHQLHVTKVT